MYALLVKNNEAYDVIGFFNNNKKAVIDALDAAFETEFPIVGISASAHKQEALYGATFDGSSFSGGTAGPRLAEATQEQLDSFDLYVFLSNNVVVARVAVPVDSPKAEMYSAAFSTGVTLAKVPSTQSLVLGNTYNWDGTSFTEIA
ncbi:MAG: hypothetical protein EB127_25210 [Alphaproteobacteria bacterium]|nr:hypothetical protein [Alphaproteobacteria bacterium]